MKRYICFWCPARTGRGFLGWKKCVMQTLVRACIVRQARMGQSQIVLHNKHTLITNITSPIALVQRCGREGQALSRLFASLSPHFLVVSSCPVLVPSGSCPRGQGGISRNFPGNYPLSLLPLPWVHTLLLESFRSYLDKRLLAFWLCVIGS